MSKYTPNLSDTVVYLEAVNNPNAERLSFFFHLFQTYKFARMEQKEAERLTLKYGEHFWIVKIIEHKMARAGVIYLCHHREHEVWTLDAYRDDEMVKRISPRNDFSLRAGKLVRDWFFQKYQTNLYTAHHIQHRAATRVCEAIGFKTLRSLTNPFGKFVLMKNTFEG